MLQKDAEIVALQALAWLLAEDDLADTFLGSTGMTAADLRAGATEPEVLASVLDFVLTDDAWVRRFCDAAGLPYDRPMRARMGLPGGDGPFWT